jgi:hypothetical protein
MTYLRMDWNTHLSNVEAIAASCIDDDNVLALREMAGLTTEPAILSGR